jgi:hypothetical protein
LTKGNIMADKPQLQLEKIEAVKQYIRAEAEHFNMLQWGKEVRRKTIFAPFKGERCGTVCCVAGAACVTEGIDPAAVFSSNPHPHFQLFSVPSISVRHADTVPGLARIILGLTPDEAVMLFYPEHWPADLGQQLIVASAAKNGAAQAELACQLLDRIVAERNAEVPAVQEEVTSETDAEWPAVLDVR